MNRTQNISNFVKKTFNLVSNPAFDEIVAWTTEGDSFEIKDEAMFGAIVLPKFFKHGSLSSFVRQLNMYGFKKVRGVSAEFYHPSFLFSRPELLGNIQRTSRNEDLLNWDSPADIGTVSRKLLALNKRSRKTRKRVKTLETEVGTLLEENGELATQLLEAELRTYQVRSVLKLVIEYFNSQKDFSQDVRNIITDMKEDNIGQFLNTDQHIN